MNGRIQLGRAHMPLRLAQQDRRIAGQGPRRERRQEICAGIAANEGWQERGRITDSLPIGTTRRVCRSRVVTA